MLGSRFQVAGVVECSNKVKLVPDAALEALNPSDFDIIVVPGGIYNAYILFKRCTF